MGFFRKIFKTRSKDWYYGKLADNQVPNEEPSKRIEPKSVYLDIWLRSLKIVDVRKGLNSFYPVVNSYISLPYKGKQKPVEFNMVTTPSKLQALDGKSTNRVVTLNKRMLGPIPYNGGDLNLEVGLFSIKAGNLAEPYLKLMENISEKAGVSLINNALQFAEPLKMGIELLTGGSEETILEVGISSTYSDTTLNTGYYTVIRAKKGEIDAQYLTVDASDYKLLYKGKKIEKYPYLVFEITTTDKKEDWWTISHISDAYDVLTNAVEELKDSEIDSAFQSFKRAVLVSSELLQNDKSKIIDEVKKEMVDPFIEVTRSGNVRSISLSHTRSVKKLEDFKIY